MHFTVRLTGLVLALTLLLQVRLNIGWHGSLGAAVWSMSGYFTIWTNVLAATVCLCRPARPSAHWAQLFTATTLYAVMVGCVYHLLLAGKHTPQGLGVFTNVVFHTIVPMTLAVLWLGWHPRGRLSIWSPVIWLAFPLTYLGWIMTRGALTGRYPYFFLDAERLGYVGALANASALVAVFLTLGLLTVQADRRLAAVTARAVSADPRH